MTRYIAPTSSDPRQLALWIEMSEHAAGFDTAERGMLGAVPPELILALVEAGDSLCIERRRSMIAAGALILRLIDNDRQYRTESTGRMLTRLGLPADVCSVGEHG
jgi:hypothetical protein